MKKFLSLFLFPVLFFFAFTLKAQDLLIGASVVGGSGFGSVWKIPVNGSVVTGTNLINSAAGSGPYASPVKANNGKFYTVTSTGGANNLGAIIEVSPAFTGITTKVNFTGTGNGSAPYGALYLSISTGELWGTTSTGGANNAGTIFKYTPGATSVTTVYSFVTASGATPKGGLFENGGFLYGVTATGGANSNGVLFRINMSTNAYTLISSFTTAQGRVSTSKPVMSPNGYILWTCKNGGTGNYGTIMKYDFTTVSSVYSFTNLATSGSYPEGDLLSMSQNVMVGMCPTGGQYGNGCIYEFNTLTNTLTVTYSFPSTATTVGRNPKGGLTWAPAISKYVGVTNSGGVNGYGTVFNYDEASHMVTKMADFTSSTGTGAANINLTYYAPLSATINKTNVACSGFSTGSATVTAVGGTAPYTYSWNPGGQTTAVRTGMGAGTYTCTVTEMGGTTYTISTTITQPGTTVSALASTTSVTCNGASTGSASVSAANGTPGYTYLWTPGGQTTATITGKPAGGYTVTVTDANGCTTNQQVSINQPAAMTTSGSSSSPTCNGGTNGIATAGVTGGGISPYTYLWNTGWTGSSLNGIGAGTYTCTITDNNGCPKTQTVTVTQPTAITSTVTSVTNVLCNGASTGAATLSASGGTPGYTYSWSPSSGTAASISSRPAATYTCTIRDLNNCTATQTLTISQPALLTSTMSSQTNITCNGGTNGAATVLAGGGTTPYSYNWTPSGGISATTTGRTAGTYTCTITDNNGCVKTQTVTLTQPAAITSSISGQTNVTCNGGTNGSASVLAGGGTIPYVYNWTPSGGTSSTTTGRTAGTYTCTITDGAGCVKTQTVTISQPAAITSSISSSTNVTCNAGTNGAATVLAGGGTSPYTYSWAPSGGNAATITGRTAGTYTCTITDNALCVKTQTVTLTQPAAITSSIGSQTNITCNGGTNGAATVLAGGGTSPYTYSWAPSGGTAATTTGRTAGTYTCTITDNVGCVKTQTVTLSQPSAITSSISTQTNVTCNGGTNGAATVLAGGGTTPYTYNWTPSGGTAATTTGRSAGTYTCTITDNAGCVKTQTVTLSQPSAITVNFSTANASCGAPNGSATAIPSGGNPGYTYQWNAAAGNQTTATATALLAGPYQVTVTDLSGCTRVGSVSVSNSSGPSLTVSSTPASCSGLCNGTATVTPTGGTLPYTYNWTPAGGTAAITTSRCAGTYTITVIDNIGCAASSTVAITEPTAVTSSFTHTDVSCNGGSNGTATITASGGTPGYMYSWAPSGGTGTTATGLIAGTYTCTVTDANSCVTIHTVTINQPSALSAINSHTDVSCNGGSDGTATAIPSGGTMPYSFSWLPVGGSSAIATGLSAGNFTCTVTDANSCVTTTSLTILAPSALAAGSSQTDVTCNGLNNGSATVTPSGGTIPYSYSWSPAGGTAATASNLSPTSYTCVITDNNGCFISRSFTISEPPVLSASSAQTDVSCTGGTNGSATATPAGGTGPYTYSWDPAGTGTTATVNGLSAGTYTCTITDVNTCTTPLVITINEPTLMSTSTFGSNVLCNGGNSGTAGISVSGGTPTYIYSWAPAGGTGSTTSNIAAGTYTCTVTDANGCITSNTITIAEPSALSVSTASTNASCNGGADGSATVTPSGGTPGYTYSWSSGGVGATENNLAAGNYTCTTIDVNGCSSTNFVTVNEPSAVSVSITPADVSCNSGNDGSAIGAASGGTGGYTFSWSSGGTGTSEGGLVAGTYTLTATDANSCTGSNTFTLNEPSAITTTITGTDASCPGGNSGTSTISASGGTGAFSYNWLPSGGTAATASGLIAGTYTCDVTDANGCPASDVYTVNEPAAFNASIVQLTNAGCSGDNNGSAQITVAGGTAPYFYTWSSGSNTDTETGLVANTYTCSFTDNNSCPGSATVTITQNTDADLYGALSFPGGTITSGFVYVFKQQSSLNGIDTVAIVPVNTASPISYLFPALPADNYLVKVVLDTNAHPTSVPTYYGNVFQWDSSIVVTHGCLQTDTANINVLELLPPGGSGFISGFVIEGLGFQNLRLNGTVVPNLPFVPGGPLKGIDVKLGKNPSGGIQARVMTDSSGYYAFENVPDGDYRIFVDIPNLPMDSLREVTIAPGGDTSLQNNYYADSVMIFIDTNQYVGIYSSAKSYGNKFTIYPNPTTGAMNLQFTIAEESTPVSFEVTDAIGNVIHSVKKQDYAKGDNTVHINAAALNLRAGVYFVSILSGNTRYTQRIIVLE
jgi:uncharacterized repeat protein (TIGR03803 family)